MSNLLYRWTNIAKRYIQSTGKNIISFKILIYSILSKMYRAQVGPQVLKSQINIIDLGFFYLHVFNSVIKKYTLISSGLIQS